MQNKLEPQVRARRFEILFGKCQKFDGVFHDFVDLLFAPTWEALGNIYPVLFLVIARPNRPFIPNGPFVPD